jgi:hypothetical protein
METNFNTFDPNECGGGLRRPKALRVRVSFGQTHPITKSTFQKAIIVTKMATFLAMVAILRELVERQVFCPTRRLVFSAVGCQKTSPAATSLLLTFRIQRGEHKWYTQIQELVFSNLS